MNTQVETSLDLIEHHLDSIRLAHQILEQKFRSSKPIINPILNALVLLGHEPRLQEDGVNLQFAGDASTLTAVVRVLRTNGFATEAARPEPGAVSWYGWFNRPDCKVRIWLYFTSSVCTRVKVGTRIVEQDVYETRCDTGPLLVNKSLGGEPQSLVDSSPPF